MEFSGRNPYMDYRNRVPFMDLSGFIMNQDTEIEKQPTKSLKAHLLKKRCVSMINFRRLKYRTMCEVYMGVNRHK